MAHPTIVTYLPLEVSFTKNLYSMKISSLNVSLTECCCTSSVSRWQIYLNNHFSSVQFEKFSCFQWQEWICRAPELSLRSNHNSWLIYPDLLSQFHCRVTFAFDISTFFVLQLSRFSPFPFSVHVFCPYDLCVRSVYNIWKHFFTIIFFSNMIKMDAAFMFM